MAQCVSTALVQGQTVLVPVADSPCTSFVLVTPAEYESMSSNPFRLSLQDASLIAAAILGVWGIAVCWRELATFIRGGTTGEDPR